MKAIPFAAALTCAIALSACAHAGGEGRRIAAGQSVQLRPGESVALPDQSRLRFVEVSSDSRCRPGLQCIRAGEALLAFELTGADGAKSALSFDTSREPRQRAGAWTVELQSLDFAEPPQATVKVEAERP